MLGLKLIHVSKRGPSCDNTKGSRKLTPLDESAEFTLVTHGFHSGVCEIFLKSLVTKVNNFKSISFNENVLIVFMMA